MISIISLFLCLPRISLRRYCKKNVVKGGGYGKIIMGNGYIGGCLKKGDSNLQYTMTLWSDKRVKLLIFTRTSCSDGLHPSPQKLCWIRINLHLIALVSSWWRLSLTSKSGAVWVCELSIIIAKSGEQSSNLSIPSISLRFSTFCSIYPSIVSVILLLGLSRVISKISYRSFELKRYHSKMTLNIWTGIM